MNPIQAWKRNRAAKRLWKGAENFANLCELTAHWLTGDITWQPGYYGTVDVDENLAPGLTDALVALNRARIMTTNSQAGSAEWEQCAAVDGFVRADDRAALERFAQAHGYAVTFNQWVWVTWDDGDPFTRFGGRYNSWDFADYYGLLDGDVYDELQAADTFALVDPVLGRNTLWVDITAAFAPQGVTA